jgi:hypothetical protein
VVAGHARDAGRNHDLLRLALRTHRADSLRGGTDEGNAGRSDGAGKLGRLGQESVAGVDTVSARGGCNGEKLVGDELVVSWALRSWKLT